MLTSRSQAPVLAGGHSSATATCGTLRPRSHGSAQSSAEPDEKPQAPLCLGAGVCRGGATARLGFSIPRKKLFFRASCRNTAAGQPNCISAGHHACTGSPETCTRSCGCGTFAKTRSAGKRPCESFEFWRRGCAPGDARLVAKREEHDPRDHQDQRRSRCGPYRKSDRGEIQVCGTESIFFRQDNGRGRAVAILSATGKWRAGGQHLAFAVSLKAWRRRSFSRANYSLVVSAAVSSCRSFHTICRIMPSRSFAS